MPRCGKGTKRWRSGRCGGAGSTGLSWAGPRDPRGGGVTCQPAHRTQLLVLDVSPREPNGGRGAHFCKELRSSPASSAHSPEVASAAAGSGLAWCPAPSAHPSPSQRPQGWPGEGASGLSGLLPFSAAWGWLQLFDLIILTLGPCSFAFKPSLWDGTKPLAVGKLGARWAPFRVPPQAPRALGAGLTRHPSTPRPSSPRLARVSTLVSASLGPPFVLQVLAERCDP